MKVTVAENSAALLFALMLTTFAPARAQVADAKKQSQGPAPTATVHADGDTSLTGETPLDTAGVPDPVDISSEESPINTRRAGSWIRAETSLKVKFNDSVSSGAQRNGDTVEGVLLEPVKTGSGTVLRPGTPVKATVLSAAAAGKVQSAGVISLQVFQVGGLPVISNVLEFAGQEGHREVADANPDRGTEATVQAGTSLNFRVLGSGDKPDANEPPEQGPGGTRTTGSVRAGHSSVGPPSSFAQPAPGSSPATEIHGATTPR